MLVWSALPLRPTGLPVPLFQNPFSPLGAPKFTLPFGQRGVGFDGTAGRAPRAPRPAGTGLPSSSTAPAGAAPRPCACAAAGAWARGATGQATSSASTPPLTQPPSQ